MTEIHKEIIAGLLKINEYNGALMAAEAGGNTVPQRARLLLEAGSARARLNIREAAAKAQEAGYDMFPFEDEEKRLLSEYLFLMDLKVRNLEFLDFIRMISPILAELARRTIRLSGQLDLDAYTTMRRYNANRIYYWDAEKVKENPLFEKAGIVLEKNREIVTTDYIELINCLDIDSKLLMWINELRYVEKNLKRPALEAAMYVGEEKIWEHTGRSTELIFETVKKTMQKLGIYVEEKYMKTYHALNEEILSALEE